MPRMSQDRVHFTVTNSLLAKKTIRQCLSEVFNIPETHTGSLVSKCKDLPIICRPSQFARFIILRHVKYGEKNDMASLNMKLVVPEPDVDKPMDVSDQPNQVREGAP